MNSACFVILWAAFWIAVIDSVPSTIYSFPGVAPGDDKSGPKYIALTFDDGPHKVLTPRLLDGLKETGAKVTFFVMGVKVDMHPTILRRAMSEGHEVANHAWNHPVLSRLPWEEVSRQLSDTSSALFNVTKERPKVMRPPYGNTNRRLNERIYQETSMPAIMWSLDTQDWQRPGINAIVERVHKKATGGTVILCHDIHPDTVAAVLQFVPEMQKNGFVFKTVSELIKMHFPK
jgi:peptidoglycan/xylan/chitin deacetylase (PgdA/CDA1 family)